MQFYRGNDRVYVLKGKQPKSTMRNWEEQMGYEQLAQEQREDRLNRTNK